MAEFVTVTEFNGLVLKVNQMDKEAASGESERVQQHENSVERQDSQNVDIQKLFTTSDGIKTAIGSLVTELAQTQTHISNTDKNVSMHEASINKLETTVDGVKTILNRWAGGIAVLVIALEMLNRFWK